MRSAFKLAVELEEPRVAAGDRCVRLVGAEQAGVAELRVEFLPVETLARRAAEACRRTAGGRNRDEPQQLRANRWNVERVADGAFIHVREDSLGRLLRESASRVLVHKGNGQEISFGKPVGEGHVDRQQ